MSGPARPRVFRGPAPVVGRTVSLSAVRGTHLFLVVAVAGYRAAGYGLPGAPLVLADEGCVQDGALLQAFAASVGGDYVAPLEQTGEGRLTRGRAFIVGDLPCPRASGSSEVLLLGAWGAAGAGIFRHILDAPPPIDEEAASRGAARNEAYTRLPQGR